MFVPSLQAFSIGKRFDGHGIHSFTVSTSFASFSGIPRISTDHSSSTSLSARKKKKSVKKSGNKSGGMQTGIKGFGSASSSASKKDGDARIDRSRETMKFYEFLEEHGAGANLKRVAIGQCDLILPSTVDEDDGVSLFVYLYFVIHVRKL